MHELSHIIELMHASTRSRLNHVVILLRGELLDAQRCVRHNAQCAQLRQHITACEMSRLSFALCLY